MQQTRIDFKTLRSEIALQYGIELDETSLAILNILRLEVKRQFAVLHRTQDEMATQIKQSKKALQVDPERPLWQAFWHGMGQWGFGLCMAVILAFALFSIDWNKERKEKAQLQQQLIWYQEHYRAAQKDSVKTGAGFTKKNSKRKNKQPR